LGLNTLAERVTTLFPAELRYTHVSIKRTTARLVTDPRSLAKRLFLDRREEPTKDGSASAVLFMLT
jgi:hypothetical protein